MVDHHVDMGDKNHVHKCKNTPKRGQGGRGYPLSAAAKQNTTQHYTTQHNTGLNRSSETQTLQALGCLKRLGGAYKYKLQTEKRPKKEKAPQLENYTLCKQKTNQPDKPIHSTLSYNAKKSASQAVPTRMQLTLRANGPTPHGAYALHASDVRLIGERQTCYFVPSLQGCKGLTTTAMHDISTPPPLLSPRAPPYLATSPGW